VRVRVRTLKRFLIVSLLTVGALSLAGAALADYTGPDRNTSSWSWERLVCDYLAEYDPPGAGNALACTLTLYEPPDGNCETNVVAYFKQTACGWTFPSTCPVGATCDISRSSSVDGCNEGQPGCRAVERIVSRPLATINGSVTCGVPGSGGWCRGGGHLSLSGSEPLSGYEILALEWTHNGATFACSGAACEISLLEGGNDFNFWAVSSYGDTSNMGSASGSVDGGDPALSGSASGTPGDNGWYVSNVTVEASAGDGVSGLASLDVRIDGGGWSGYGGPVTIGDGSYEIELRAVDVAGNSTSESFNLDIDTQSPIVDLFASPSFCPGCGETLDITVVVQDGGSGIAAWSLEASGISVASGTGQIGQTISWNGGGIGGGVHTLELEGQDVAGNTSGATFDFAVIVPTPAPNQEDDDDEGPAPFSLLSPTPLVTGTTVGGVSAATRTPVPTRTPVIVIFGGPSTSLGAGPPAAPQGPAPGESISSFQSPPTSPPAATSSVSAVLYGAAAAALIATAMAIGVHQKRRREVEEARVRAEMEAANRRAEAEEAEWRATMAAIIATTEAARRAKNAVEDARLTRMETRLEPKVPLATPSVDMAKLKQADYAAGEAWEAGRQDREAAEAYAAYRAGEIVSEALSQPRAVEKPWWESALDWVDQHQVEIAIGIGVVAAAGAIILTGGAALPVVAAVVAAGALSATGTVGLNAHYDRPLGQNVLRNGGVSLVSGAVTAGAWALATSGLATRAALGIGNTIAGACAANPAVCARLEPALQLIDTGEQVWLSAQLAVQTATRDPRAGETYIELQLELADGGVPGNTAVREIGQETLELLGQHTDEATQFLARYADDGIDLVDEFGTEILAVFEDFGDEGVEVAKRYGNEGVELLRIYDGKPEAAEKLLALAAEGSPSPRNWSEYVPSEFADSVGAAFKAEPIPITLSEDLKVYRYWSEAGAQEGHWVTLDSSLSPEEARELLALPADNRASQVTEFVVPKGTTVLLGSVAGQASAPWAGPYALGGGVQLYLPNLTSLTHAPGP